MTLTREDIDRLSGLKEKTEDFISEIFNFVGPLNQHDFLDNIYSFKAAIEYKIKYLKNDYWGYEDKDGDICGSFSSYDDAYDMFENWFFERCNNDSDIINGETRSEDVTFVHYKYGEEGEIVELERREGTIEYEHYHGDLEEHGIWHSGGGGVL